MTGKTVDTKVVKALRVGVLLGETLIEERIFHLKRTKRAPVTIGQSTRATFGLPDDGLPKRFALFRFDDGQVTLRFDRSMRGRIALMAPGHSKTELTELTELRGRQAKRHRDVWEIPLEPSARGRIEIGEVRFLFQFVDVPPLVPRPRLPASIRGSLGDRIDSRLALILGLSLVAHVVIGVFAFLHDKTIERRGERLQNEYTANLYTERDLPMPVNGAATDPVTEPGASEPGPGPAASSSRALAATDRGRAPSRKDASEAPVSVDEAIRNTSIMSVLSQRGDGESRYSGKDSDAGKDLAKSIGDLKRSGDRVAADGDPRTARRGGDLTIEKRKNGDDDLNEAQDGGRTAPPSETKLGPRVKFGKLEKESPGPIRPPVVLRKIKFRYLRGIKACHSLEMKRLQKKLGGRVELRFTVGPTGKTTESKASGFNRNVDSCITKQMRSWRFSSGGADAERVPTSFSIPLVLKAGEL